MSEDLYSVTVEYESTNGLFQLLSDEVFIDSGAEDLDLLLSRNVARLHKIEIDASTKFTLYAGGGPVNAHKARDEMLFAVSARDKVLFEMRMKPTVTDAELPFPGNELFEFIELKVTYLFN